MLSQVLALVTWYWVASTMRARAAAGAAEMPRRVRVPRAPSAWPQADEATAEAAAEDEELTQLEYDERELTKMRNSFFMRAAIVSLIHWYWGAAVPLVVQVPPSSPPLLADSVRFRSFPLLSACGRRTSFVATCGGRLFPAPSPPP